MKFFSLLIFSYFYVLISSLSLEANEINEGVLYIRIGENIFLTHLYENPIRKELISLLPLKSIPIEKNDYKCLPLSLEIDEDNTISDNNYIIQANEGDIILYQKKELILINNKATFDNLNGEYIKLGYTEEIKKLYNLIQINKPVYLWNSFNYVNYNEKIKPNEHYMSIMNFLTWKILTIICFLFL